MDEHEAIKGEAIETLAWASSLMRPSSEGGQALHALIGRLRADGATFGAGEPATSKVTYAEIREALDRDWPDGSDLANAIASLVERICEPGASPSP